MTLVSTSTTSPKQPQLSLLVRMHELVEVGGSQFMIATHSPILLGYPRATIYQFGATGIHRVEYEDTEHYQVTRTFLNSRQGYFQHLFSEDPGTGE